MMGYGKEPGRNVTDGVDTFNVKAAKSEFGQLK
jgi:hypothetical protein